MCNGPNGCNGVSLGDHCVPEGDRIPSLKSHGKALEQESGFPSSVTVVTRLPISCVNSLAISCHTPAVSTAKG